MENELPVSAMALLWWNTSLSPTGRSRATSTDIAFVSQLLSGVREVAPVDLIALGEVADEDVSKVLKTLGNEHLSVHQQGKGKRGRNGDIAVIYDRRRLALISAHEIVSSFGDSALKVGEQLTFAMPGKQEPLHIVVSHWSSRMFASEHAAKRAELGGSLRRFLDRLRMDGNSRKFIVLMGDYNDDPYSPSLAGHLLATRDRELVIKHDSYIYNPAWRWLGESVPYAGREITDSICGTYFYPSGTPSRWFTFDQIMFSSAFLQDGPLTLVEEKSMIIRAPTLESKIKSRKEIFDHLPIMGVIGIRS